MIPSVLSMMTAYLAGRAAAVVSAGNEDERRDTESVLEISLADGFNGAEKLISLEVPMAVKNFTQDTCRHKAGEKIKLAGQGIPVSTADRTETCICA